MGDKADGIRIFAQLAVARAFLPHRDLAPKLPEADARLLEGYLTENPSARSAMTSGSTGWLVQCIEESSRGMSEPERLAIALAVIFQNPLMRMLVEEDVRAELVARRGDVVLEALQVDLTVAEAEAIVAGFEKQLIDSATGPTRRVLIHPMTGKLAASGAALVSLATLGFLVPLDPLADIAIAYAQGAVSWPSTELSRAIAVELCIADRLAEAGDLGAMRDLSTSLCSALAEASRARAPEANWTWMPQHIAILSTALAYAAARLGEDDDDFLPDLAPDLEGLRNEDAQNVASFLAIDLRIDQKRGDFMNTVFDSENFIVFNQRPRPGAPLGKRRRMTVDVRQYRKEEVKLRSEIASDRSGRVFRVSPDGETDA